MCAELELLSSLADSERDVELGRIEPLSLSLSALREELSGAEDVPLRAAL